MFCCYSAAAFQFLGSSRRICFVCSPYVRFIHALWWIRSFFEHILSYPLVGFRFDLLNCVARMDWSKHRGKHGVLCKQRHRTHTVAHRSSSISETSAISFAINVLLNATFLCEMVWKTEFKFCNICCNYFCSYFTHTHIRAHSRGKKPITAFQDISLTFASLHTHISNVSFLLSKAL